MRARQNSIGSNVETLYHLFDNRAEAIEFRIGEDAPVIGVPIMNLKLKDSLLIACITGGGKIIFPRGQDTIEQDAHRDRRDNPFRLRRHQRHSALRGGRKEKMNAKSIRYILGWILNIEALLMLLPVATAVFYREEEGIAYALVVPSARRSARVGSTKSRKIRVFTRRKALSAPR